jgi:hypothetical protein
MNGLAPCYTSSQPLPSPVREYHKRISAHLAKMIRSTPTNHVAAFPPTDSPFNAKSTSSSLHLSTSSHSQPLALSPETVTTEGDDDKNSSLPTLPILATPPEFTARPNLARGDTVMPAKAAIMELDMDSREAEQRVAWATDGHRVYKAPVEFALSLSERSRRGSEASSEVGVEKPPRPDRTLVHSASLEGDSGLSLVGTSSIAQTVSRTTSYDTQERTRAVEQGSEIGDLKSGESYEDYEERRQRKFAKKQRVLEARVNGWYQGVIDAGPSAIMVGSPSLLAVLDHMSDVTIACTRDRSLSSFSHPWAQTTRIGFETPDHQKRRRPRSPTIRSEHHARRTNP